MCTKKQNKFSEYSFARLPAVYKETQRGKERENNTRTPRERVADLARVDSAKAGKNLSVCNNIFFNRKGQLYFLFRT